MRNKKLDLSNEHPASINKIELNMIEVFKTNINNAIQSCAAKKQIHTIYPHLIIDFDLEDCDKIMRIEGDFFEVKKIIIILKKNNFNCLALD